MITDIVDLDLSDNHQTKPYFLLVPFTEKNAKVYIPMDAAEQRIRKTMSREQALDVIRLISGAEELKVTNEKERELRYKEAVRSADPMQLVMIIKNLYRRKEERLAQGKKCTSVDERYYKIATHNLHAELAFALDCTEAEVGRIIRERVEDGTPVAL
jgi:CarD family transcriptional regulator